MRRLILIVGTLTLAALLAAGCGGGSSSDGGTPPPASSNAQPAPLFDESSIEYQLAVIDEVADSPDDATVLDYDRALDLMQAGCTDTRRQLGDYAVNTSEAIGDALGKPEGVIVVLKLVRDSIPEGYPRRSCVDLFVSYATLRTSGGL